MISRLCISPRASCSFDRHSFRVVLDLSSLSLYGPGLSMHAGERPFLAQRFDPSVAEEERASFFHLKFESHPLSSEADYRVHVHSQPLQLTYHPVSVCRPVELSLMPCVLLLENDQ